MYDQGMEMKLKLELSRREADALFSAVCAYQDQILRVAPEDRDKEMNDDFDVMVAFSDALDEFFFEDSVRRGFSDIMAGIDGMLGRRK